MKGCFPSKASDNAFSSLRYTFGCLIPDMLPAPDCAQSIRQRTVLFMVQDTLRLRWFFSEQDIEMAGPLPSAEDLRGNAWKLVLSMSFSPWTLSTILAMQTSQMRGFINEGLIAVLFTGPPCETWSSLRAGEALQVTLAVTVGPVCRGLLTAEWIFGLPGLHASCTASGGARAPG